MADLRLASRPTLRRPVLIAAFRGWNDGGQGASLAAGFLARTWHAARFGDIDPENFFDFQETRPHVSLVDGVTRQIDWPDNAFYHAAIPGAERDALLLLGVEPNVRWRTFTNLVTDLAGDLGVELVVTLGSLLADVPHTRPSPVTGSASDAELVTKLGLQASRYEGPTGIVGVLLGTDIDTSELEEASESYSQQVTEAVAADPETAAYVEELEQRTEEIESEADLPSGDAIAAELTRFLRERERGNGGPDGPAA